MADWDGANPTTATASAKGNPYTFTGRQLDALDLDGQSVPRLIRMHYRHRDYDTYAGRFLQHDPLGHIDGLNLYQSVISSPVRLADPLGLSFRLPWRSHRDSFVAEILAMNCPECPDSYFEPLPSSGRRGNWGWMRAFAHYVHGRTGYAVNPILLFWSVFTGWEEFDNGEAAPGVPGHRQFGASVEFRHDSTFSKRIADGELKSLTFWGPLKKRIEKKASQDTARLEDDKCMCLTYTGKNDTEDLSYAFGGDWDATGTLANGRNDQYSKVNYEARCCAKKCKSVELKCRVRINIEDLYTWDSNAAMHKIGRDYWQIVHFDKFIRSILAVTPEDAEEELD